MTLLAAFQTLLHRYSNQDEIVVGTPIANRNQAETEGLIGFFVNTLFSARTLAEILPRGIYSTACAISRWEHTHQDLPFEQLVDERARAQLESYASLPGGVCVSRCAAGALSNFPACG